jgi:hypothetical protein
MVKFTIHNMKEESLQQNSDFMSALNSYLNRLLFFHGNNFRVDIKVLAVEIFDNLQYPRM